MEKNIIRISNNYTTGVEKEIESLTNYSSEHYDWLNKANSAKEYISLKETMSSSVEEYSDLIRLLPSGNLKVLDIGVGMGQSSVFLATKGYKVYALEPVPTYCDIIDSVSKRFDLNIQVIEGVAEDIEKIGENDFDVIFFNASLHHCDDPIKALQACYKILKKGGQIVLASENFLKPWMSKKRWYYLLNNFPLQMGHYGGNEHVYYNWEYIKFLKSTGFGGFSLIPSYFHKRPSEKLKTLMNKKVDGENVYSDFQLMARFLYYYVSSKLLGKFFFKTFAKASVFQSHFIGQKLTN